MAAVHWSHHKGGTTGPILPWGEIFAVLGWVHGDAADGESRWWVTPWGSHIWVGGTVQEPSEKLVFDPDTVRVKIGYRVYYPAGPDGTGREVVVIDGADLHKWAANGSAKVGTVERDQKPTALYWCEGDEQEGEDVWWMIKPEGGDPIDKGPRLHVVHIYQRPA